MAAAAAVAAATTGQVDRHRDAPTLASAELFRRQRSSERKKHAMLLAETSNARRRKVQVPATAIRQAAKKAEPCEPRRRDAICVSTHLKQIVTLIVHPHLVGWMFFRTLALTGIRDVRWRASGQLNRQGSLQQQEASGGPGPTWAGSIS